MIAGDEISLDPRRYFAGPVRIFLREPDPFDRRMARCDLAAKEPDPASADDCEPDALRG
jgi:hypothetical protein